MKQIKFFTLALLAAASLSACSDDEAGDNGVVTEPESARNLYVINQGNFYGGVEGGVGLVDTKAWTYEGDVFRTVNSQSLGDSPQGAIAYGSKIYVPMYGSNLLWVLDRATLSIVKQVPTNAPEGVVAADGYVFVSNNDGYVSRLDTLSLTMGTPVAVGPNPCSMVAVGSEIFVSISDGYNYPNYDQGKKVCVLNASTGQVVREVACGLNPGPITCDGFGNVFVVARGNYGDVPATVQKIAPGATTATDFALGDLVAACGNELFVLSSVSDYATGSVETKAFSLSTLTADTLQRSFVTYGYNLGLPVSLQADEENKRIYICSDNNAATGYKENGTLHVFTTAGVPVSTTAVGIHPCGVVLRK